MRSLCDAGHDLVVGQTFRLKTLFVLVGLRAHGLTARDIVIGAEDPEEFHRIRIGLHEDYEPTSTIELELVDRLAGLVWRLRRKRGSCQISQKKWAPTQDPRAR